MARTVVEMKYTEFDGLMDQISAILQKRKYKNITQNNENVWKCGVGFWTAMKYIKIEFGENQTLIISGWVRAVMGKEQDLEGVYAAIPKKQVMNAIKEIQAIVK